MPNNGSTIPPALRFWPKVAKTVECWDFTGCIDRKGYGKFGMPGGKIVAAHRFSYELAYGPIPDGLWVLHKCDNRRCVRPDHLFLGTAKDNTHDMIAKGRNNTQPLPVELRPRGERHGMARLAADQVLAVRAAVEAGTTQKSLAAHYGVSRATICLIVKRKIWSHI